MTRKIIFFILLLFIIPGCGTKQGDKETKVDNHIPELSISRFTHY